MSETRVEQMDRIRRTIRGEFLTADDIRQAFLSLHDPYAHRPTHEETIRRAALRLEDLLRDGRA